MEIPKLKPLSGPEYERERRYKEVNADIERIDKVLEENSFEPIIDLHRELDGKYQACIANWGKSMFNYNLEYGFNYSHFSSESAKENLKLMKAKIKAFAEGWNITEKYPEQSQDVTVNVTNSNEISINITFEDVRKSIDDMGALTIEETEEIKAKIDELERIANEESSKKKKWEKVKPIIAFALDKGVDIATQILMLVVQMKLGK